MNFQNFIPLGNLDSVERRQNESFRCGDLWISHDYSRFNVSPQNEQPSKGPLVFLNLKKKVHCLVLDKGCLFS